MRSLATAGDLSALASRARNFASRRPRPERIQRETHMILRDLYFREAASGGEHWNDNSTIIATSI